MSSSIPISNSHCGSWSYEDVYKRQIVYNVIPYRFIDFDNDLTRLAQNLYQQGDGLLSITSGVPSNDWFPEHTLYPEGLYLDAPIEKREAILSVVYDYFMIGTIYQGVYSHHHWYHYPIRPCTYFYSQLHNLFFENEKSSFVHTRCV